MKYKANSLYFMFCFIVSCLSGGEIYCITNQLENQFCGELLDIRENSISLVQKDLSIRIERNYKKGDIRLLKFSDHTKYVKLRDYSLEWKRDDFDFLQIAFYKRLQFWNFLRNEDRQLFIQLVIALEQDGDYVNSSKVAESILGVFSLSECGSAFVSSLFSAYFEQGKMSKLYELLEAVEELGFFNHEDILYSYVKSDDLLDKKKYVLARESALLPLCMNISTGDKYIPELYQIAIQSFLHTQSSKAERIEALKLYEEYISRSYVWPDDLLTPQQTIDNYESQKKYNNCMDFYQSQ